MNDGAILRGMRSKDPRALEKLMDKYIPYVSVIVWNFLRTSMSKEDAEEWLSQITPDQEERHNEMVKKSKIVKTMKQSQVQHTFRIDKKMSDDLQEK